LIQKEDDVPGAPNRVVLTYGYWQQAFGGSVDVVGQSVVLNAAPYEVIGVLPASFSLLDTKPQVLVPLRLNRASTHTGGFSFKGVARLKPGMTLAQANDDIARMIPHLTEQFPLDDGVTEQMWKEVGLAPNVRPLAEDVTGELNRPLWFLLGMVVMVLLIAWTNVANLLLVRAETRRTELAIRQAVGASRRRIACELLSESLTLGLTGGALGSLFAQAGIALLRWLAPAALPNVDRIAIEPVVLAATLTISVVTSLLFGLIPVFNVRVFDSAALKETGHSTGDAPARHRTRHALVVAQLSLALVLMIVSGLMGRTFMAMRQIDPGYARSQDVLTFRIGLPAALVRERPRVNQTYEQIAERLRHVPDVAAVGLANSMPMDGAKTGAPIFIEDRPVPGTPPTRWGKTIGPGYFEALGIPLIAGRHITWSDVIQQKPVWWISENLAREYWGEPSKAVGRRIGGVPGDWFEIAGVVGNVREQGVTQPAPTTFYMAMSARVGGQDSTSRDMIYVIRSSRVGTPGFVRELQQAVWSVNPNVPFANMRTMTEIQAASMAQTSFASVMLAVAAGVALLLALVGVYGMVSHIAAERTHEVGIRMALGAQGRDVRRLFLRRGVVLTLTGIGLGVGGSITVTPLMSGLLHGVASNDPATFIVVVLALGAASLLAMYLPVLRASLVDPVVALRCKV
jgi:predicted permease